MVKLEHVEGSLIELAHKVISERVKAGDTVVDATIGNGHDTLFLAKCVGVVAFSKLQFEASIVCCLQNTLVERILVAFWQTN